MTDRAADRPARRSLSVDDLERGVLDGDRTILARAITLVESHRTDHHRDAQDLLRRLMPCTGQARRVGVSGVPGAGKSTFIESLGMMLVEDGHRVAVLAVDPTSTRTGGSILGDKTRMTRLAACESAFIRPSPSGGHLGGVARKTRETLLLCEAAGFDVVLVETVGVGQSEAVVAEMVDFFVLLMIAGAGDELQGIKRGILELADLIAINKADGDNRARAEKARQSCARALRLLRPDRDGWTPPVVTVSALEKRGLRELWAEVERHHRELDASGALTARRREQLLGWTWSMVRDELERRLRTRPDMKSLARTIEREVLSGELTPTLAAERLLEAFRDDPND